MIKSIMGIVLSGFLMVGMGGSSEADGLTKVNINDLDISENIKEAIKDTKIYITENEIEEMKEYKKYFATDDQQYRLGSVGISDNKNKVIYIEDVEGKKSILLHEIAHAYDNNWKGRLSNMADFKIIHSQEAKKVFNKSTYPGYSDELISYYKDQRHEYFAESYAIYKTYPDFLKQVAPMTYKYMQNLDK